MPAVIRTPVTVHRDEHLNLTLQNTKKENIFITCSGKRDGVGAQVQAVFSTMLFAREMDITYVHTPFEKIEHNDLADEAWAAKWEDFFSLGLGELKRGELSPGIDEIHLLPREVRRLKKALNREEHSANSGLLTNADKGVLFAIKHCHPYADRFPNKYSNFVKEWREKYHFSSKDKYDIHDKEPSIRIAIHARRNDVTKTGKYAHRYTANSQIVAILKQVLPVLSRFDVPLSITLHSSGEPDEFQELIELRPDLKLLLSECTFTTFHSLVSADVLIMAKSSFSYAAALLSQGVKIYEPFWHSPLDSWLVATQSNIDENALERKVCEVLRIREDER